MANRKPIVLVSGELQQIQAADALDAVNVTSGADPGHTHDARYYTETELDAGQLDNRYFRENEFQNSSDGGVSAGKPIVLDANGHIDATMINDGDIDHGSIGGLAGDDHAGYHTDGRAVIWLAANHETTYNHANYDTAYDWGDHAMAGYVDTAGLTAARVPYASDSNTLIDSANLTFNGTILSTGGLIISTGVIEIPVTTGVAAGVIWQNGVALLHAYHGVGTDGFNIFLGGAGNFSITGGTGATGSYNMGIGSQALNALTIGARNVAVGVAAGLRIGVGSDNFCLGYAAGAYLTGGAANVFIGSQAGNRTTGIYNTFIGYRAGYYSLGNASVIIGYDAGYTTGASGQYNTFIGGYAGKFSTGGNGVHIGYTAGYYETAGGKLFIDNTPRASEADARVKAMVYGIFAATTAAQYLTINGHLIALEDLTTAKVLTPEIKTDTSTPTDLTITTGAAKTLVLDTVVYEDLQFPVATGKVTPASGEPSWETFTANTKEYAFGINDYIDLQVNELFHNWKEGTAGHLHVHYTIKTAQSTGFDRFVKFSIWVAYSDKNEVWVEQAVLSFENIVPTGSPALQAFYFDMGNATLTNYLHGGQVKIRVKRIAATGGTEYNDDVYITQVGMHLEINKVGSVVEAD